MSEITEFLLYNCDISVESSTWEDEYWTPIKSSILSNEKCFIDSPKAWIDYNESWIKIDAILFLESTVNIKAWYKVSNITKDWTLIDWKSYKVISIEPLYDDDWGHHIEANLEILW